MAHPHTTSRVSKAIKARKNPAKLSAFDRAMARNKAKRSNKGGAVRGRARAAAVRAGRGGRARFGRRQPGRTLGPASGAAGGTGRPNTKTPRGRGGGVTRPRKGVADFTRPNRRKRTVARTEARNRAALSSNLGKSGRTFRRRNR